MNLLTGIVGNAGEVLLEKNGRFYRYAEPGERPKNAIDAIVDWNRIRNLDMVEVSRRFKYLCPVIPGKMFLPAVNFRSHSKEASAPDFKEPYFFTKFQHALVPNGGNVVRPTGVERLDYEGEIGIIIGKGGKYIDEKNAENHIFGYTIVNDVTIRDYQSQSFGSYGKDWVMGKNADTALPMGPWITPREELEPFSTTIETRINGELLQNGTTDDMIFRPEKLIARLSRAITLQPGDLISTGTPSGVAEYATKKYLQPGDTVEISVKGIGTLKHGIVDEPADSI